MTEKKEVRFVAEEKRDLARQNHYSVEKIHDLLEWYRTEALHGFRRSRDYLLTRQAELEVDSIIDRLGSEIDRLTPECAQE